MIHTNRCKHCNKTKDEHTEVAPETFQFGLLCDPEMFEGPYFQDSGLAALDAHKEELWEAIVAYKDNHCLWGDVENILNQIEKEK